MNIAARMPYCVGHVEQSLSVLKFEESERQYLTTRPLKAVRTQPHIQTVVTHSVCVATRSIA